MLGVVGEEEVLVVVVAVLVLEGLVGSLVGGHLGEVAEEEGPVLKTLQVETEEGLTVLLGLRVLLLAEEVLAPAGLVVGTLLVFAQNAESGE